MQLKSRMKLSSGHDDKTNKTELANISDQWKYTKVLKPESLASY